MQNVRGESMSLFGSLGFAVLGLLSLAIGVVLSAITQGALVHATVAHFEGRRSSFGESVTAGLRMVLPLFLMALMRASPSRSASSFS